MRHIFIYASLFFLAFGSSNKSPLSNHGGIIPAKRNKLNKIFVISVGVSAKFNNEYKINQGEYAVQIPCPTCITDAKGISRYIKDLKRKLPNTIDTVLSWEYPMQLASKKNLDEAFFQIQQQSAPDDILLFYYASASWGNTLNAETKQFEGYYNLKDDNNGYSQNESFTLSDLKTLTDRIAARRQLVVFDTGFGDLIQNDFYKNFFSDNPTQALFTQKERIILCPETSSSESMDVDGMLKGDLFKLITNMPDSLNVFTLFDDQKQTMIKKSRFKKFMQQWYQVQQEGFAQIKILREQQYLEILTAIKPIQNNGKRGNILLNSTASKEKEENLADEELKKKAQKKALVIATNKYMANQQWPDLRNALNDGEVFAGLLKKNGYNVISKINATQDDILDAITELCNNSSNPYDQHIVYIAGHGYYDKVQKAGFVVCYDSKALKEINNPGAKELKYYLDYTVLFRNMELLNKVVLITDVCFGGTSMNSMLQSKQTVTPLKKETPEKNPYKRVLSSGIIEVDDFVRLHNGTVSDHSPFAEKLLSQFQQTKANSLSFESLFDALNKPSLMPRPIEFIFGENVKPNEFIF
ncbi:MAG: caspase family protein [Ferruginibacter sp.]